MPPGLSDVITGQRADHAEGSRIDRHVVGACRRGTSGAERHRHRPRARGRRAVERSDDVEPPEGPAARRAAGEEHPGRRGRGRPGQYAAPARRPGHGPGYRDQADLLVVLLDHPVHPRGVQLGDRRDRHRARHEPQPGRQAGSAATPCRVRPDRAAGHADPDRAHSRGRLHAGTGTHPGLPGGTRPGRRQRGFGAGGSGDHARTLAGARPARPGGQPGGGGFGQGQPAGRPGPGAASRVRRPAGAAGPARPSRAAGPAASRRAERGRLASRGSARASHRPGTPASRAAAAGSQAGGGFGPTGPIMPGTPGGPVKPRGGKRGLLVAGGLVVALIVVVVVARQPERRQERRRTAAARPHAPARRHPDVTGDHAELVGPGRLRPRAAHDDHEPGRAEAGRHAVRRRQDLRT